MNRAARFLIMVTAVFFATARCGAWTDFAPATWQNTLARMPLVLNPGELNRTNAVHLMLRSFGSNSTVKALIFMPGATDEFYMFHRARALLTNAFPSLLDAVNALAEQTLIKPTFTNSMLLLHTEEDSVDAIIEADPPELLATLAKKRFARHAILNDADWNTIEPMLKKSLSADIRPWRGTFESWHFYRHSFASWNLDGIEALQATALAGKSRALITKPRWHLGKLRIVFACDTRVLATPKITEFPR